MNVRTFLNLLGDRVLATILPEGQLTIDLINDYTETKHRIDLLTGISAVEIIEGLDPEARDTIYNAELNDGVDLMQYRKELQSLLEHKNQSGKTLRQVLAFGMSTLLAIGSLSTSFAIVWIAYYERQLPGWELCLIAFGIPGMVVWQFNGVLTQERKDFLAAALGRTPQAGIIGGLLGRMGASTDIQRRREDQMSYGQEDKFRPQTRPRGNRSDHGGPPAV